jgi:hypothetical protein
MAVHALKTSQGGRRCVLDRVAVLSTAPVASFLALLFELFLGFGVGKSKEQFNTIMLGENGMEFLDDTFCNVPGLESEGIRRLRRKK